MFLFVILLFTVVVCGVHDDYNVVVAVAAPIVAVDKAGINDLNNDVISIRICSFWGHKLRKYFHFNSSDWKRPLIWWEEIEYKTKLSSEFEMCSLSRLFFQIEEMSTSL